MFDDLDLSSVLTAPCVRVYASEAPGQSYFGGQPKLPVGVEWPVGNNGQPLSFLAAISLEEVHRSMSIDWLPATGSLLYFYDVSEQPFGSEATDRGSWCVIYVHAGAGLMDSDVRPEYVFDRTDIALSSGFCVPMPAEYFDPKRIPVPGTTTADKVNLDGIEPPFHQIGGFPLCVQGDTMELECQLLAGTPDLPDGASYLTTVYDWKLLLQLDSDECLSDWCDAGKLFFWVQGSRSAVGDFTNVWVHLQTF